MPTSSMKQPNGNNNSPNNNPIILLLIFWLVFILLPNLMLSLQPQQEPVEEVTEEEVDEEVVEEENKQEEITEDFIVVKSKGIDCTIMYFKATRIMYVSYHRGDLVMLTDVDGTPLTYDRYLRLLEK